MKFTYREYEQTTFVIDEFGSTIPITKKSKMNYTNKIHDLPSAIENTTENNYVVGSFDGKRFSVSGNPTIHTTSASARAECGRLAKATPGKMYIFLQLKGAELVPQAPRMSI